MDIDQCPQRHTPGTKRPLNIFAGTDKCKQRTTMVGTQQAIALLSLSLIPNLCTPFFLSPQCEAIMGLGFRRGSYKCLCRKGFYFPDVASQHKFFNGSLLEEEYEKLMLVGRSHWRST